MIVQHCSILLGNRTGWEDRYEVLGDDIVIFDKYLAQKYLDYMSAIGVPINVYKSVVSLKAPVVEYAKRTSIGSSDVSPVSWKMMIKQSSFAGRISLALFYFNRVKENPIALFRTIVSSAI